MRFLSIIAFALCLAALPVLAEDEDEEKKGITSWDLSCKYHYQGNFVAGPVKGIDCNVATVAFPGTSNQPINPFGECYFIDNTTKDAFFVPLKTPGEWESFKLNLPKGVNLRKCEE